jgi:hypothetical protein
MLKGQNSAFGQASRPGVGIFVIDNLRRTQAKRSAPVHLSENRTLLGVHNDMSFKAVSYLLVELHAEEWVCMDENGHFAFRNFQLHQS